MKKVSKSNRYRLPVNFLFLSALIVAADQLTKHWAFEALFLPNTSFKVSSFLNLVPSGTEVSVLEFFHKAAI